MDGRKRIDIITIHFGTNHGSVLQAYALSTYLNSIGCDAKIIDYVPARYSVWNSLLLKKRTLYPLPVLAAYYPIALMKSFRVRTLFRRFLKKNLKLTRRYKSKEDLKKTPPQADIYITGSDQVWNNDYNGNNDFSYFLDFVPDGAKRFAYAASFGKEDVSQQEYLEEIEVLLRNFNGISVREKDAQHILSQIGFEAVHVVDPVFLLSKDQWRQFSTKHESKHPYILVYVMDGIYGELLDYAQKLKEETGDLIYVVSFKKITDPRIDKCFYLTTPKDFIGLIDHAEAVITNSFHGTAFSILFQKNFITIGKNMYNSRMLSLLGKLALDKHFIPTGKDYGKEEIELALKQYDAEHTEAILHDWIVESKEYFHLL